MIKTQRDYMVALDRFNWPDRYKEEARAKWVADFCALRKYRSEFDQNSAVWNWFAPKEWQSDMEW